MIFEQQWQDIAVNFIINLFDSSEYNIILTIICRLSKERHYISYIIDDEDITVEKTAEMLIQWVYWTHDLSSFIVSDQDLQFISILWKFLQMAEHFSSIVHHLLFSNQRSKRTSQSEHQAISSILLFIYAERLI